MRLVYSAFAALLPREFGVNIGYRRRNSADISVMSKGHGGTMETIHERATVYSTKPLNGVFRYNDIFQIYPSKRKTIRDGREFFPLTLELSFPRHGQHYFRYGYPYGSDQLTKQIVELHHLLSVVTQYLFFGCIKSTRPISRLSNRNCGPVARGQIRWYQDKALDDRNITEIVLPDNAEAIIDKYYALSDVAYQSFRRASYLFYTGTELRRSHTSLSFASIVSAIETLMSHNAPKSRRCESCGQPKYRLNARFREFIIAHAYRGKENASAKKFISRLYSLRSKLLHEGGLMLADLHWMGRKRTDDATGRWEESFLHKDLVGVARVCLINWLASQ
jgi:hypothetical protein